MKYLSVCSGIEAATQAWHPLGWEPVGFSEIEPFPAAVLKHHYPQTTNHGDMTKHEQWNIPSGSVDLLVGGTPCQSFSVAGLRKGLHDPRGGLMLTFLEIAQRQRPRWIVWENVPGVLSSNGGRDFGSFLGALGELGYGWAYRVLDAQWFGVAQRRRRVFVVGCLGDGNAAAKVLFERESVRRDSPPSREKRQGVAGDAQEGAGGGGVANGYRMQAFGEYADDGTASAMKARDYKDATDLITERKTVGALYCRINAQRAQNAQAGHYIPVASKHDVQAINGEVAGTLDANYFKGCGSANYGEREVVADRMAVRRLTPRECERLQGFPDDYTMIPWRNKPADQCPDGPRYKALGNSMAVPCMAWIGKRIDAVERENRKAGQ